MRPLNNDPKGTALFLEREASRMHPLQGFRELVQNGIEARAASVLIDGYADPDAGSHLLARVTDDGVGMAEEELLQRLSTLHGQSKGDGNFGIGARIAALPRNLPECRTRPEP